MSHVSKIFYVAHFYFVRHPIHQNYLENQLGYASKVSNRLKALKRSAQDLMGPFFCKRLIFILWAKKW